jgi:hypothetical protein
MLRALPKFAGPFLSERLAQTLRRIMLYVTKGHLMRITYGGYEGSRSFSRSAFQFVSLSAGLPQDRALIPLSHWRLLID